VGARRRVAAGVALLGLALSPPAAATSSLDALLQTFPVLRRRVPTSTAVEASSWRYGSRRITGFAAPPARTGTPTRETALARFPAVASDPFLVEGEGVRVVLRAVGARGTRARRAPGALLYRDVFAHTDAWQVPMGEWTEEYLHLRSRRAPRRFAYEILDAPGAVSVTLRDGQVLCLAPDGRGLVALAPVVVDAAGRRSATAARWALDPPDASGARRLTLLLDPAGLDYPLLVDPSWVTTGSLNIARYVGVGILLHDDTVLTISGSSTVTDMSELYDVATGRWTTVGAVGPMATGRSSFAAVALRDGRVLVIGGILSTGPTRNCRLHDPATRTWGAAGSLGLARARHTATLLSDGRVLVAAGVDGGYNPVSQSEVYNPATNSWTDTGSLTVARERHSATLLRDGRVMVTGGRNTSNARTAVTEVYNPATGLWTRVGDLGVARNDHSATMLPDGRVLAVAGDSTPTAEIFAPASGLWTAAGALPEVRYQHSATLLPSGKVLVAGGTNGTTLQTAHLYDPTLGQWSAAPSLASARYMHSATMLPDGRVLVAGGYNAAALASAELYEADAPFWTAGPGMTAVRAHATATLLRDGRVLVAGGSSADSAETRDPVTGVWSATLNTMSAQRSLHSATGLVDGRVLVAGSDVSAAAGKTADIYDPGTNSWASTGEMATDRYRHGAALLPCGEVLVAGGVTVFGTVLKSAERYNPRTGTWRPTGDLTTARWLHTTTQLADGRVLVAGGYDSGVLASAEVYDPVTETWTPTSGPMTVGRHYHGATLLPDGRVLLVGGVGTVTSAEVWNPATGTFSATGNLNSLRSLDFTLTLLPNGRVLAVGGDVSFSRAETFDPATGAWSPLPDTLAGREYHTASLTLDGRILVAGGLDPSAEVLDVGRGELLGWRPVLSAATDPLPAGTPITVTGTGFRGLGEAATGFGSQHSATNYPLVQLRRLDNAQVSWLRVDPAAGWSDTSFRSLPVGLPPGPALATVFTNGIPSVSKAITVECPSATITTGPSSQAVCEGGTASFAVASSGFCTSHQWRKDGVPITDGGIYSGASTSLLVVSGVPAAAAGGYDVVVSVACSNTMATSAPATLTVAPPLGTVDASLSGPATVCTTCLGGTASETHSGGGAVTRQWGYRTTSGGTITDIPGATSPTYVLNGIDFPAEGSYLLVVRVTPTCGSTQVSDEVAVTVSNVAAAVDEVPFFTVTSRNRRNVLEWVYPPAYDTVQIRYTTGTPCVYPIDSGGTWLATETGTAGERGSVPHDDPLTNDETYCYTVFVDKGGTWSAGRTGSGRPFDTGGSVKWAFSSGLFSTTPPTVGGAGVIATNNANAVHAMARGSAGGEWPAGWRPVLLGGAVQGRSPVVPITVASSNPVAFVGAQDGRVYAVDAAVGGAAATPPWALGPASVGGVVQAAPGGLFTAFGGGYNYVLVGTRDASADNAFVALNPGTGVELGRYAPASDPNRMGAVSGAAAVDYGAPSRVYFASRKRSVGSTKTLWCLRLGASPVFTFVWARSDLGDIDGSPTLRGGRVYVGSAGAGGTLFSLDAASGGGDRTFVHGDGQVKSFVFPDRVSPTGDLVFSTDTRVWVVSDDAGALTPRWAGGISLGAGVAPSTALLVHGLSSPTSQHVFVGASDGRLYQVEVSGGTPVVRSVVLGDGSSTVGAPSFDRENNLVHVGSAAGIFYAVLVPLP
jgi:hypothetical protein